MSTAVSIPPDTRQIPPVPVRRFTVEEYHRLAELGIITPDERLELIRGWLVPKVTHNPPHAGTLMILQRRLNRLLPEEWITRAQLPVTMHDSEPEPGLVVVPGPEERYFRSHPHPRDVVLVVEVADTSLTQDRGIKWELYASVRIPEYWIVNLIERRVEVFTDPRGGRTPAYRRRRDFAAGESVPVVIAGEEVGSLPVRELLPPAPES
ncbi:MAG TPA: Uma2 family endonuclease [Gemmataceae bacterium]